MHGLSLDSGLSFASGLSFIHGLSVGGCGLSDIGGSVLFTVDFGEYSMSLNDAGLFGPIDFLAGKSSYSITMNSATLTKA